MGPVAGHSRQPDSPARTVREPPRTRLRSRHLRPAPRRLTYPAT